MSLLISDAWADAAPAAPAVGPAGAIAQMLPFIAIFVLFYFMLIRPQMKRAKELRKMIESLAKNDEVVTSGGLLGKITDLDESFITVEIAEGVRVKIQKNSVTSLVPKGTAKS